MKAPLAAMAALAGGLLFLPAVQGPASATSVPINLKNVLGSGSTSGSIILVGHGGGGGGGGFSGGGRRRRWRRWWRRWRWRPAVGWRRSCLLGGGRRRSRPLRRRRWPRLHERWRRSEPRRRARRALFADNGPGHVYSSSRSYAGRDFNRSGPRSDVRRGNAQAFNRDRGHDHGDRNRPDHRRFAERDHDHGHDFDHHGRHRVFRNGAWVWIYGPDYYYSYERRLLLAPPAGARHRQPLLVVALQRVRLILLACTPYPDVEGPPRSRGGPSHFAPRNPVAST